MKTYDIVVIDPPWKIQKIKRRVRPNQVTMDYPMLSLEEIKEIPLQALLKDNAYVFMWVIDKYLHEGKSILEAWGLKYHLTMSWDKTNGVSLYGFNRRTEFIMVGIRGKHDIYPSRKTIKTSFTAKSTGHSKKPDHFYEMLNTLDGERLDMFARKPHDGWDVWGNEVDSDIDLTLNKREKVFNPRSSI